MIRYAVVIAAYNEARTIGEIVAAALRWCPLVYVVDDGSDDGTAAAVADLGAVLLRHERNEGKGASLWDGMQAALAAGAEAVITLDGDRQHDPDDIPRLMEHHRRNPEQLIIGTRLAQGAAFPRARYYANRFANFWISWACGYAISDSQSGFRIYPATLLRRLPRRPCTTDGFVFESEVLIDAARMGFRAAGVPIAAIYRSDARPSHFRAVTDVLRITRMVAGKLLRAGMYPRGLWNVLLGTPLQRLRVLGRGAVTTLLLSAGIMVLSLGITWCWALGRVWYVALRTPARAAPCDALLVLGLQLRDGAVTESYSRRLERARGLFMAGCAPRIVLLGGRAEHGAGVSEAAAGRDYLIHKGVPARNLMLEDRSRNTLENLRHGRALLATGDRVTVISSRAHLARCQALAAVLGLDYQLCAAESRWTWDTSSLSALVKESLHLHWYYTGRWWARITADPELLSKTS